MAFYIGEVRRSDLFAMSRVELDAYVIELLAENKINYEVLDEIFFLGDERIIENHFVKNNNSHVRSAAARCKNLPTKFLKNLSNDKDPIVRSAVGENPNVTHEILLKLATDKFSTVRESVARCTNSEELIMLLKKDSCENVRAAIAANRCVSENILEELANDKKSAIVREKVAENANTSFEIKEMLAKDSDYEVRASLALSNDREIIKLLCNDTNVYVLELLCCNKKIFGKELRDIYAKYKRLSKRIVTSIASNKNTPSDVLENIYETYKELPDEIDELVVNEKILGRVAYNPNTPKNIIAELAKSDNVSLRASCAYCIYKDILLDLASDEKDTVLQALACNKFAMHDRDIVKKVLESPHRKKVFKQFLWHPDSVDVDKDMVADLMNDAIESD